MKISILRTLSLTTVLVSPILFAAGCAQDAGPVAPHVVAHSESDKKGWFGGTTHAANTVYKNPDGSTSIENETTTVKNGTTTIVRERKTTAVDGSVKTDKETHTIVKGSDNTVTESKTSN